jgi:putative ABC transport system substrate-binding protein
LGYVDGVNITVDWRWSQGNPERFPALASELVATKPDVIVASATQAVRAAKTATATIPIVMTLSSFPEKIGFVDSLSRPGGNVTGLSNVSPELIGKRLELLKEVAPNIARVAVLWDSSNPVGPLSFEELLAAAAVVGVKIESVEVRSPDGFTAAFTSLVSSRPDALYVFGNPVNFRGRKLIADFAVENRMASVYEERLFAEAGGLVSYAPSFADLFRRAAGYVDRILRGTKPSEMPVELPTKFEFVINLRTAKALGLTIPPMLLARADEVIE